MQEAFEKLKQAPTMAQVLAKLDFSKPFTVQTDASNYAIGAVRWRAPNRLRELSTDKRRKKLFSDGERVPRFAMGHQEASTVPGRI